MPKKQWDAVMIIRIFQVTINPEYRDDFERDFKSISIETVKNHNGLISCNIGGPTKWNPDDYTMVTIWESEASLEEFAGLNWNQAIIPLEMKKYPKSFSVAHYENIELS